MLKYPDTTTHVVKMQRFPKINEKLNFYISLTKAIGTIINRSMMPIVHNPREMPKRARTTLYIETVMKVI